jgi:hypothetical protein
MSDMVERIALAMVYRRKLPDDAEINWEAFRADARAAIEAMRVPTEDMIEAAYGAVEFNERWQIEDDTDYRKALNAMIDEALK